MKISIIGAGHIGQALAQRWAEHGHDVRIANSRNPDTLDDVARHTGARAGEAKDIVHGADVIVLTIPLKNVASLRDGLFAGIPDSVPVIDTCNYYPQQRDGRIDGIEDGMLESRWVEKQIGRSVVKVFNNIYAAHLRDKGKPKGAAGRIALPVSGDNADKKAIVMDLVNDLGFDAVDNGALDESWRHQPGTPVYTTDRDTEGVHTALQTAQRARTDAWRATPSSPGTYSDPR
ncbi:MAG TPA: NADPH-dependent F420 reductase [Pararobbsia sp.]|nr:NADPH-dependent F420 reductase [Pararobbsia sp.]